MHIRLISEEYHWPCASIAFLSTAKVPTTGRQKGLQPRQANAVGAKKHIVVINLLVEFGHVKKTRT